MVCFYKNLILYSAIFSHECAIFLLHFNVRGPGINLKAPQYSLKPSHDQAWNYN